MAWEMMPDHTLHGIQAGVPWAQGGPSAHHDVSASAARVEALQQAALNAANMGVAQEGNLFGSPEAMPHGAYWNRQYVGKIRSFNQQKGFGFIDCQDTLRMFGRDVFVHRNQIAESGLHIGQDVLFEVELNESGQPQARRLQLFTAPGSESAIWASYAEGQRPPKGASLGSSSNFGACMPPRQGASCGSANSGGEQDRQSGANARSRDVTLDERKVAEPLEEMLWKSSGPANMWEIIEQHGHLFGKSHVTIALYHIGLCRYYQGGRSHESLTSALVDRLVLFSPSEFSASEASRVLWALAGLEELRGHQKAHNFAVQLAEEAEQRLEEFSTTQMVRLVTSLTKLVKGPGEDELLGRLITSFSDYVLGSGLMPRFPPEEMRVWTVFLESLSTKSGAGQGTRDSSGGDKRIDRQAPMLGRRGKC